MKEENLTLNLLGNIVEHGLEKSNEKRKSKDVANQTDQTQAEDFNISDSTVFTTHFDILFGIQIIPSTNTIFHIVTRFRSPLLMYSLLHVSTSFIHSSFLPNRSRRLSRGSISLPRVSHIHAT